MAQPRLHIDFTSLKTFKKKKIVVTKYEEQGFGNRGAFIDGRARCAKKSNHLLQVLVLTMRDPGHTGSIDPAKLTIFDSLSLSS